MNWNKFLASAFLIIVICVVINACGGSGGGEVPTADDPTVTAVPADTATIGDSTVITLQFSVAMDPAMLVLTGTMASESNGVWSTTTQTDDTLTITPLTSWTEAQQTLIIDLETVDGAPLATLTLNYTVDASLTLKSVAPGNTSFITGSEPIVISFNETVDINTVSASGSLWADGNDVWSASTSPNDTLTISPVTTWAEGAADLTLDVDDLVGNALTQLNLTYTVDLTPPIGSAIPANNGNLFSTENVVISFDESMNTGSDIYAGSLVPEIGDLSWSATTHSNDTITISPLSSWSVGTQTLEMTATDLAGNAATLNLSYTVAVIDICSDGIKNSDETDIDCGGSTCAACADGLACTAASDCSSNICTGAVCQVDNDRDGWPVSAGDCDDADSAVHPGAVESCNGIDDDCDSTVDEAGAIGSTRWYRDADGDNYGITAVNVDQCSAPVGYVADSGDCDDSQAARHPGAVERCNGFDDDCDGATDESFGLGVACSTGVGTCQRTGTTVCDLSGLSTICDAVPGAPGLEVCDALDNDCDGQTDEESDLTFPLCPQQVGVCAGSRVSSCSAGSWSSCDATSYGPSYEAVEVTCDGLDNDCDGIADEDLYNYDDPANCTRHTCSGASGWTLLPLAASTVCRAATGSCDMADVCDGLATACPADGFKSSGTACEDGNACTASDTCDGAGVCTGGTALICDDGNACTNDSCNTNSGCQNLPNSGQSCDDGNVCTSSDTCDGSGACIGGTSLICDDGNQCTADSCDTAGGCQTSNVADDTPCDDGNPGTSTDKCTAGLCAGTL